MVGGVGLDRQRQRRQSRPYQIHILFVEAALAIRRKRIDHACSLRAVAAFAESEEPAEIIRSAHAVEFFEHRKPALSGTVLETPAHPRLRFAGARAANQIVERAFHPNRFVVAAMSILLGMNRVQIAPPSEAVTAPLRV